jgi:hypothetical protein
MKRLLSGAFALVVVIVLVLASGTVGWTTAPASAGAIVDPNTLQPVPPNATCREAGGQVICDTFLVEEVVNEPITDFDLPCGTIYETSHFRGDGRAGMWMARSYDGTSPRAWREPGASHRRAQGRP